LPGVKAVEATYTPGKLVEIGFGWQIAIIDRLLDTVNYIVADVTLALHRVRDTEVTQSRGLSERRPNPCWSYPRSSAFIGGHIFFVFFVIL
jgi:hypothetical protein